MIRSILPILTGEAEWGAYTTKGPSGAVRQNEIPINQIHPKFHGNE